MIIASSIIDTIRNIDSANPILLEAANWEENLRLLGIKIINVADFSELLLRLALNVLVVFVVVQYMYAKNVSVKIFISAIWQWEQSFFC